MVFNTNVGKNISTYLPINIGSGEFILQLKLAKLVWSWPIRNERIQSSIFLTDQKIHESAFLYFLS